MNGQILRELPIAVDYFVHSRDISLYFLTHAHADHTVGLTSRWKGKVYCTPVTAKLIRFKLAVEEKFILPLEEMQRHTLPLRLERHYIYLTVTLIPANHCPGSCMFLFETVHYRILYTGDFRPDQTVFEIGKSLWGLGHEIDTLYLDNTYCEPACVLPTREKAADDIVKICKSHPDHTVSIGISWIGHEDLLEFVAQELQQYIVVTHRHMEVLKLLRRKNVFTTDKTMGRVHALPTYLVSYKRLKEMSEKEECIGIHPTGKLCHCRHFSNNGLIHTVPHSNHAPFSELWEFVKSVRPRSIRPVVPGRCNAQGMESKFRADTSQFDCLLDATKKFQFTEPQLEACRLTDSELLDTYDQYSPMKRKPKKVVRRVKKMKPCGVVFDDDS